MKNPIKAQVQVVIDNLTKVLPYAQLEKNLNMLWGSVPYKIDDCGTSCCHGGWYIIAKKMRQDKTMPERISASGWGWAYLEGAKMMALDLGFKNDEDLEQWAVDNPELWGNDKAEFGVFANELSFQHPEKRPEGAKTLQHIIDHWTEVRDRLPK